VLQDLFVILFLAVQPSLDNLQPASVALSFGRVGVLVAAALLVSRYLLPPLFRSVARLPELVLVGALAWCFLVGELAAQLHLSREMGALVAGVSLSTFPYALDVTAKVTSLRDFFVTLFFVGLGMTIPLPSGTLVAWALVFAAFVVVSRLALTFAPLYLTRNGLRASLLPSINLCQVSEFSLVIMAMGLDAKHLDEASKGLVSFAFVLLAALSTFAMAKSDRLVRAGIPWLKRLGLRDLDDVAPAVAPEAHGARILIIGFFRTASSLLEELRRTRQDLVGDVAVVDFNPLVHQRLRALGVKAIYGDISQPDTLRHAGVGNAEILVCTIPDTLLKGTTNLRLVRQLREMNPEAMIVTVAEVLSEIPALYEAGACYVSVARLDEAADLCEVLQAVDCGLIDEKCGQLHRRLERREEVLP
jgi:voltage-gated potassium channel Kch